MARVSLSSIRVRLIGLVTLALLPVFVLILLSYLERSRVEKAHAIEKAETVLESVGSDFLAFVDTTRLTLTMLTKTPAVAGAADPAGCSAFLAELLTVFPAYANIGVADRSGTVYCSAVAPEEATSIGDRLYFRRALQARGFAVGEYQIGRITKRPTLNMGQALVGPDGSPAGVVFAAVDLGWLASWTVPLLPEDGSILTITDESGKVLVGSPAGEDAVGTTLPDRSELGGIAGEGEEPRLSRGADGVDRLYVADRIGGPGSLSLRTFITIPAESIFASANADLRARLGWLFAITAVTYVAAWLLGDVLIVRKVRALIGAAKKVTQGDMSVRVEADGARSEIDDLIKAFNEMSSGLEESLEARQRAEMALRERNEALIDSRRELEQINFLATHHLHEPLMRIWASVEMLQRKKSKLDDYSARTLDEMLAAVNRMNTVITDLLAYSQEELGMVPTDCGEVLERVLAKLEAKIADSRATITWDSLPTIDANPEQIGQVLEHLIDNALSYRSLALPKIHVGAEQDGEQWRFSVSDNGIGIDPSHHKNIFVIFKREHTRASFLGTGIGLAICKKIVERHSGRIWVESEVGKGATFHFTIPAKQKLHRFDSRKEAREHYARNGGQHAA